MYWLKSFWCWWTAGLILFTVCASIPSSDAKIEAGNGYEAQQASLTFSTEETAILEILASLVGMSVGDITAILNLSKLGLGVFDAVGKIFEKVFNGTSFDFDFQLKPGTDRQLLSMFEIITLRLDQIQRGIKGTEASLLLLAKGMPHMVRWEIALDTLEGYMKPINNLYHRFSYYQKHKMNIENHTLLDFAKSVVSHSSNSIQALMANIHSMVAPADPPVIRGQGQKIYAKDEYEIDNRVTSQLSRNLKKYVSSHPSIKKEASKRLEELTLRPSIFLMLEDALNNYDQCHYKQSPQQLVFGLYTLLSLTLARGYSMITFSYNILKYYKEGNFTVELQFSDSLYLHYSKGLLRNGVASLSDASNSYKRCDPARHSEGQTFVMVTELLQGYIENEVDLNPQNTCGSSCPSYNHAQVHGCYFAETQYCGKHRRCKGTVHECRFFHSDADVCISSVPYRRYEWIRYENKRVLGEEGQCENVMKVDSWWRFLYHCSYCVCLCDDAKSPSSDRFISLLPVVSDIVEGMVVTGVRFLKKNRVIHMQVQEGQAMAQGQVNPNTVHWVDVEPISVDSSKYMDNRDYFTFKYEARNIDLDKLKAPKGHIVTGFRFRTLGSHINLEMWVTPINFTTGALYPNLSFWISNDNTPVMSNNPRKELLLHDPDDPRNSGSESEIDSHSDMFVKLQQTSMDTDVSQLTVPFFDAQPVAPSPSTWLEGLQIYHRGRKGFGGFIGLKVFNFNLTMYFDDTELETEIIQ